MDAWKLQAILWLLKYTIYEPWYTHTELFVCLIMF